MEFHIDGFRRSELARRTIDFTTGHGTGAVAWTTAAGLFTGLECFSCITGFAVMRGLIHGAVINGRQIGILVVAVIASASGRTGCCEGLAVQSQ